MCGILGIVGHNAVKAPLLVSALQSMHHRGPDDKGMALLADDTFQEYALENSCNDIKEKLPIIADDRQCQVAFAHARLAIVDLSIGGHQPMISEDGRYAITYNGELYNYKELRERFNLNCKTGSDTEVLLKCFQLLGADCVNYFIGMWAFAIYDRVGKTLFASRDPFGIKPFYYSCDDGRFVFSSEIKSLLGFIDTGPDMRTVYNFLINGIKNYDGATFFENVSQLEPKHNLIFCDNEIKIEKYTSLSPAKGANPNDLCDKFYESLEMHLRSDVPVGVSLSGGIDSNIICSALATKYPQSTRLHFSGVYPGLSVDRTSGHLLDESPFIDAAKDKYKLTVSKTTPTLDFVKQNVERMIWYGGEPARVLGIMLVLAIYEDVARHGIKVILNGQGADEIFGGYGGYVAPFLLHLLKNGKLSQLGKEINAFQGSERKAMVRGLFKEIALSLFKELPRPVKRAVKEKKLRANKIFQRSFIKTYSRYDHIINNKTRDNEFTDVLIASFGAGLREYLDFDDKMSMMHSVESRVPFLSLPFVRYGLGLSPELKIGTGTRKKILREQFKDILPKQVYDRKDKTGYASPQGEWIEGLQDMMEKYLRVEGTFIANIINMDLLDSFFAKSDQIGGGVLNRQLFLWRLLSLEIWHRIFFKDGPVCFAQGQGKH